MFKTVLPDVHPVTDQISRRAFLKYCSSVATLLALPATSIPILAEKLSRLNRPAVIWLSFQECTGCTESFTRSHAPTIEELIFNYISLDYHHTLQAASGEVTEEIRKETISTHAGKYLLIVDGSIPVNELGAYSTIAGRSNLDILQETTEHASAVIAIGTCAAYGGIAAAEPNPTGAQSVMALMQESYIANKPLVNIPGCPPIPIAISGVLAHYLAFDRFPELDALKRPVSIYGNTVHERCSRFHFYQEEKFALSFDDEGARKGWCLYKLGCKGPVTHNACAVDKWNRGTSFPIEAGHPCIGCSEPNFWDKGGFYQSLDEAELSYQPTNEPDMSAVSEGQHLYQNNCVYCHSENPGEFSTPADEIARLLRSGDIRSHSRLEFSDDQLSLLEKYFKSVEL